MMFCSLLSKNCVRRVTANKGFGCRSVFTPQAQAQAQAQATFSSTPPYPVSQRFQTEGVPGRSPLARPPTRHVQHMGDFTPEDVCSILNVANSVKQTPEKYISSLAGRTLLMLFSKASLRTRVSFEAGMTQMGGHAIYYNIETSPLGTKETYADTAQCLSRFVDVIMARVPSRKDVQALCESSTIPVINALDDYGHPCQILADLQTLVEKKKPGTENVTSSTLRGLKMAYFGDTRNNVTYDIMRGAALMGLDLRVAGPDGGDYEIPYAVVEECNELISKHDTGGTLTLTHDPAEAANGVDVVYTDSWMSYGISKDLMDQREKELLPYQVNCELMTNAKDDAIFMNCLPAMRGAEQTSEVIDGPQSVVFDQAENRLHAQKSLLLHLVLGTAGASA